MTEFAQAIQAWLSPIYVSPHGEGGHDLIHVCAIEKLGLRIAQFLSFDPEEYRVASWLHNLDRCFALQPEIQRAGGLKQYLGAILGRSPFNEASRNRIVDAILQHSKRLDEPADSSLLTALRIADRVERFTPLNIIASAAHRGHELPLYDRSQPFGFRTMRPCVFKFFFWNLEWVGMLPSDEARALINPAYLRFFLDFLRLLGRDIAEREGIENRVEEDLKAALGAYYEKWALNH